MRLKALDAQAKDKAHAQVLSLVRQLKMESAFELCREQLETWPDDGLDEAWHNLFYVQDAAGNKELALESIEKAIDLNPTHPGHRDARACLALELRKYETVASDCTALLEIEKQRESIAFVNSALAMRAYAQVQLGNYFEAEGDLESMREDRPFRILGQDWTRTRLLKLIRKGRQSCQSKIGKAGL